MRHARRRRSWGIVRHSGVVQEAWIGPLQQVGALQTMAVALSATHGPMVPADRGPRVLSRLADRRAAQIRGPRQERIRHGRVLPPVTARPPRPERPDAHAPRAPPVVRGPFLAIVVDRRRLFDGRAGLDLCARTVGHARAERGGVRSAAQRWRIRGPCEWRGASRCAVGRAVGRRVRLDRGRADQRVGDQVRPDGRDGRRQRRRSRSSSRTRTRARRTTSRSIRAARPVPSCSRARSSMGSATRTYDVPALDAGQYSFVCSRPSDDDGVADRAVLGGAGASVARRSPRQSAA